MRLRNKIILYTFILLCFMILSYSIYNIVKWKLDSNNTNKQIEEVQETVRVEEVIDTENTEVIEQEEGKWKNYVETTVRLTVDYSKSGYKQKVRFYNE